MAYSFQLQREGQFQLNAYNADKSLTLKRVNAVNDRDTQIINGIISLLTVVGAQSLYPITDSKRIVDQRVTETT